MSAGQLGCISLRKPLSANQAEGLKATKTIPIWGAQEMDNGLDKFSTLAVLGAGAAVIGVFLIIPLAVIKRESGELRR